MQRMSEALEFAFGSRLQAMIDRMLPIIRAGGWWHLIPPDTTNSMRSVLVDSEPLSVPQRAAFIICHLRCQSIVGWDMSEIVFECFASGNELSVSSIEHRTCCKISQVPGMLDEIVLPEFDKKVAAALKRHVPAPTPKHWMPGKHEGDGTP